MKIPKLKKKAFTIDLGIYPYSIFVCFLDLEEMRKELLAYKYNPPTNENIDKLFETFKKGDFAGRVQQIENGNLLVYFPNNFGETKYMVNTITHEVFHCTHMILDRIGLKLNFKNDEAFCYLNGFINEKIFEQI